jgi:hypothetical protein
MEEDLKQLLIELGILSAEGVAYRTAYTTEEVIQLVKDAFDEGWDTHDYRSRGIWS